MFIDKYVYLFIQNTSVEISPERKLWIQYFCSKQIKLVKIKLRKKLLWKWNVSGQHMLLNTNPFQLVFFYFYLQEMQLLTFKCFKMVSFKTSVGHYHKYHSGVETSHL